MPVALTLITSRLLPVPHGFTTRGGGVSEGAFAELNVGSKVGDFSDRVEENHRRVARAALVRPEHLCTVSQVHGDAVAEAAPGSEPGRVPPPSTEADALWTSRPGVAVGVKVADCVPVLLSDPEGRVVAAVHSGWRGTEKRVAARAVEELHRRGVQPSRLLAAIGPSIGKCCYSVSSDLAERFASSFGEGVAGTEGGLPRLDLKGAVAMTLLEAGLLASRIEVIGLCTSCDRRFFSHRRDGGITGRQMAFIASRGG
ncbi:MAG: peptidoglycan editing factor PgeF [Myxococcales bacterium]|nr:peptidoglycan editing factor PgeF [Myxococcales bacterium]